MGDLTWRRRELGIDCSGSRVRVLYSEPIHSKKLSHAILRVEQVKTVLSKDAACLFAIFALGEETTDGWIDVGSRGRE